MTNNSLCKFVYSRRVHELIIIDSRNKITQHYNSSKDFIDFQNIADLNGKHHLSLFTK